MLTSLGIPRPRCELFRLLGEPQRLRVLGLVAIDELSVGELAELLHESQPNVSRHVHLLRRAGILCARHQGTRVYVRLAEAVLDDSVIHDAVAEGQRLCEDVPPGRVAQIVAARENRSRAHLADQAAEDADLECNPHVPVYAMALSMMSPHQGIALDAGTGDGSLLDFLAPSYDQVIGVDRSSLRIEDAKRRVERRGYSGVRLECTEVEGDTLRELAAGQLHAIFASRILHHTSSPRAMLEAFAHLLMPGGRLCIVDYRVYEEAKPSEQRSDPLKGFSEPDLQLLLHSAGFGEVGFKSVPRGYVSPGFDAHRAWFVAIARRV